jgi:hypothetical protein
MHVHFGRGFNQGNGLPVQRAACRARVLRSRWYSRTSEIPQILTPMYG